MGPFIYKSYWGPTTHLIYAVLMQPQQQWCSCSRGGNERWRVRRWVLQRNKVRVLQTEITAWKFFVSVWRNCRLWLRTATKDVFKSLTVNSYLIRSFCDMMIQLVIPHSLFLNRARGKRGRLSVSHRAHTFKRWHTGNLESPIKCAYLWTITVTKAPGKVPTQAQGEKWEAT